MLKSARETAIVPRRADPGFAIVWLQGKFANWGGRETDTMKRVIVAAAMLALIAMPAYAQMGGKRAPKGDDKKADQSAAKKVDEKAYKAALERIPEPKEKYDPWGVARPADPAKKPKQTP